MGARHSREEPIIFYNQKAPLELPTGLEKSREAPKLESTPEIEEKVRERVQQELAKRKDQQDVSNQRAYSNLYKNNIDNDHNSVALKEDIEGMIEKLKRTAPSEIPADIAKSQEALIVCYKNNQSRPLDCWEQVENFKESIAHAQKKFVATHQ